MDSDELDHRRTIGNEPPIAFCNTLEQVRIDMAESRKMSNDLDNYINGAWTEYSRDSFKQRSFCWR